MGYPDLLIFSSILLTTSVQQISHLFFDLQHCGQLTRDLKGSFFSMSSNITDSESISRSMLKIILPRTYTAIHEEKGSRACYRNSQRNGGIIPLKQQILILWTVEQICSLFGMGNKLVRMNRTKPQRSTKSGKTHSPRKLSDRFRWEKTTGRP